MQLLFEKSKSGMQGISLPQLDVPKQDGVIPDKFLRDDFELPELNEVDIVRHYTALSKMGFGVDNGFYPLGSCTMKYNPKINEVVANLPGFTQIHPYQPLVQGALELLYNLESYFAEITGMHSVTFQPSAGAHGELTGLMIIKKYFEQKGEKRTKILTPDSSHGTNPATATMCGYQTITIKSDKRGTVDIDDLKRNLDNEVSALMITNPNTLGLFEEDILEISKIMHEQGALVYGDGANMNALLGITKPGDLGIDVIHLNLHKTFSIPHGSGGPGACAVGVKEFLTKYLPNPRVIKDGEEFKLDYGNKDTIGRVRAFYGNFNNLVRAYTYIRSLGPDGLRDVAEHSILNANYLKEKLRKHYRLVYDRVCMHEFVLDDSNIPNHLTTMDIAKRLIDYGFHPPTIYFPLIVHGAMMIEPTETESKEMLDSFIFAMIKIKEETESEPEVVRTSPHTTPVSRLDNVKAAREPDLRWKTK